MKRYWAWGAIVALMSAGNLGCYYDELQAEKRANRVLQEDLAGVRDDLQSCQLLNSQKDTTIASLKAQMKTKDEMISSLTAEAKSLRDQLAKASAILEKYAATPAQPPVIIRPALPEPLHKELKALAEKYPDVIEYDETKGAVRWKADLLFDLGSDRLKEGNESVGALKKFAEIVNGAAAAGFDVVVVGHTCTTPIMKAETLAEHKTNWHLSAHRAISVMSMLGNEGVGMDRMGVMGYGEHRPIAGNDSNEGKAKNRRVEIYLVPKESVQSVGQGVYESKGLGLAFLKLAEPQRPATGS